MNAEPVGARDRTRAGLKPLVTKGTDHPGVTDWIRPASELGWGRHLL